MRASPPQPSFPKPPAFNYPPIHPSADTHPPSLAPQIFLTLVTIAPWAALIAYDLLLYCARALAHEVPLVGGRARGAQRPRAPSLTEHANGHRRRFSLRDLKERAAGAEEEAGDGVRERRRWSAGAGGGGE